MDNLPDNPVLRKRAKLRKRYPGSRQEAHLAGADFFFPDAHCSKCGTWAVIATVDNKCQGCTGSGPYAGERQNKRRYVNKVVNGYYMGRVLRSPDARELLDREEIRCDACGAWVAGRYHIDHIMPASRGGPSEVWNSQILCATCHKKKRDMLPDDWFAKIGKPVPDAFAREFSRFHLAFSGNDWQPGGEIDFDALPATIQTKRPHTPYKRKNPTTTSPAGKMILTPAKYWHRDYRK
jgi:5-methylcytosine-specific restriction endonuclease McrA